MALRIIPKHIQGTGAFNRGQIIENKPIGFPRDGGHVRPYGNLFYWAKAEALVDSTIGLHPHQGFEIMSFVLEGRIRHFDTAHQEWRPLNAGDVQIIRAGKGIEHSEQMDKDAVIFQIWTDPDLGKTLQQPASYHDYRAAEFPVIRTDGCEEIVYVGEGSPLTIDTSPLSISRMTCIQPFDLESRQDSFTSYYILNGSGTLNGQSIAEDDFIIVEGKEQIQFRGDGVLEIFRIVSPVDPGYLTYAQRLQATQV